MDVLRISGGARLCGTLPASGSKNASLPIMAASILIDGPIVLEGVPDVTDVNTLALLLGHLGVAVKRGPDGLTRIETVDATPVQADYELVRRMRASVCVLGPLVARRGRAVVSLPGGCQIGTRPVELHLAGLRALGADIRVEHGYVLASARELRGAEIDLAGPYGSTVTGTANVLCAAVLARGKTVIRSAAREPEIVDLGEFLNAAGARIDGLGTSTLEIIGVEHLAGLRYRVIPDRIEAATLLMAAAITQGTATITGVLTEHLGAVLESLAAAGVDVAASPRKVTVHASRRPRAIDLVARPYPGIPTDVQAQWMALLSLGEGTSTIRDDVFPERFLHVDELARLGARIERQPGGAIVRGVHRLTGAEVTACDLRASAALVLAALAAEGDSELCGVGHLDRGYERLDDKLRALGAQITRHGPRNVLSEPEPLPTDMVRPHVSVRENPPSRPIATIAARVASA